LAVDPNLAAEQQQAQDTLVKGLQTTAQMDTAQLMSIYGTRLALSAAGTSPLATGAVPALGTKAA
jgi:hypothetical protein